MLFAVMELTRPPPRALSIATTATLQLDNQWKNRGAGFGQIDYALRNATWHVADLFAEAKADDDRRDGFLDPFSSLRPYDQCPQEKADLGTPAAAAAHMKHVARLAGAGDVGVAAYDERWQYKHRYSRAQNSDKPNNEEFEGCDRVIVIVKVCSAHKRPPCALPTPSLRPPRSLRAPSARMFAFSLALFRSTGGERVSTSDARASFA